MHVGSKDGFVEGAAWVHRTKGTNADYHHYMNATTFPVPYLQAVVTN